MSNVVDNRIVEMRFDNRQFESNVAASMSTLDKLKQKLNFSGATKGLDNVGQTVKRFNMNTMLNAADAVRVRFSALQIAGITALQHITTSAIHTGKQMTNALTIDPVKTGLQEYETQIGAVQTILANTQHQGTNLQQVNKALDELNTYADKTIYNFTEMTRNIGTFTAAGIDLRTSTDSIKGIANLAAVSGSTAQQASTAMYQLSQALAAGRVSLMDWNSVVNAGMGGKVFQDALLRTSELLKTGGEEAVKSYGSFRESLTEGKWLTTEVLTETLKQFAGAYSEQDLIMQGFTKTQAKEIAKMAVTAEDAATKVKTFSQLWDTLKESAQSGWTSSWEIMIGDFDEAKETLTQISDSIGSIIGKSADARNKILSEGLSTGWKQLLDQGIGDEEAFIKRIKKVARESGSSFDELVKKSDSFTDALKTGLEEGVISSDTLSKAVFSLSEKWSKMSLAQLKSKGYSSDMVKQVNKLAQSIKDGSVDMDEFTEKMLRPSGRENVIDGLWDACKAFIEITKPVKEAFRNLFPEYTGDQLYYFTEKFRDFTKELGVSAETIEKIKRTFTGLFSVLDMGRNALSTLAKGVGSFISSSGFGKIASVFLEITASIGDLLTAVNKGFSAGVSSGLSRFVNGASSQLDKLSSKFDGFIKLFSTSKKLISDASNAIADGIATALDAVFSNISASDVILGVVGAGAFLMGKKLLGTFKGLDKGLKEALGSFTNLFDAISGKKGTDKMVKGWTKGLKKGLSEGLDGVFSESFGGFKTILGPKFSTMFKEVKQGATDVKDTFKGVIDFFRNGDLTSILHNITASFDELHNALVSFTFGIKVASLVTIAIAVGTLTASVKQLVSLNPGAIEKALTSIGGMLIMLALSFKSLAKTIDARTSVGIVKAGITLMLVAKSIHTLSKAMVTLSKLKWGGVQKGLVAIGGGLLELIAALKLIQNTKASLKTAVVLLALAKSCTILGDAFGKFTGFSWDEIAHGLAAMGGALGELVVASALLGKFGGLSGLLGSVAIFIGVQSFAKIADTLQSVSSLSWDQIKNGLAAMGTALTEVALASGILGKLAGLSGLAGSSTLLLGVQSLKDISTFLSEVGVLSWDQIKNGLAAMGTALTEVALASGILGKLAGLSGLIGSGAILLAVQGLGNIADALKTLGGMSWDQIKVGLVGMGGSLSELAIVSGLLGTLSGPLGIFGSGSIVVAVQGLGKLADGLKTFGEMSWDEIKHGLAAMGGALAEVGIGSFLSTLSGIGAASLNAVAGPLGTLADSLKKWAGVTLPKGLALQLGEVSSGVRSFTLGGWGADTISTVAEPLGIMADSVKKWNGVTVPDGLGDQVGSLASGLNDLMFGGQGASALAVAAEPIGVLADSVKKWSGVTVPEGLGDHMTELAHGVQAFTLSYFGGASIDTICEPLEKLAKTISKWSTTTIPEGIADKLKDLASGINAFTLSFAAGISIDIIVGPLKKLADAIKKWNGVAIPDGMGSKLGSLATGIKNFTSAGNLSSVSSGVEKIATSFSKLSKVNFGKTASGIGALASSIKRFSSVDTSRVKSALSSLGDIDTSAITSSFSSAASKMTSSASRLTTGALSSVSSSSGSFSKAGSELASKMVSGFSSQVKKMKTAVSSAISSAASAIRSHRSGFSTNGGYLASGLISGINAKKSQAYSAGYALGKAAVDGEKAGQRSKSPSKATIQAGNWLGEGLVIGMKQMESSVYRKGHDVGEMAANSMSTAASSIANLINEGMDSEPTIRPVLDLTDVRSGVNAVNGMMDFDPSIGASMNIASINALSNQRLGMKNENDIVSSIDKLRDALGSGGDTFNVNGITYDDGSNITDAVKTLVRAARVERRS